MEISQLIADRPAADVITCNVDDQVRDVVAKLAKMRIGALPVMQSGQLAGIFSERALIYRMADQGSARLEKPVGEVMTAPAITVEASAKVDEALGLMTRRRIRHLPVVDKGSMCGFISIGDLVKARMDQVVLEAEAMRSYIQTA